MICHLFWRLESRETFFFNEKLSEIKEPLNPLCLISQTCDLHACSMSEWVQNCNEFGGPSSPNLEECLGSDDGCGAFKEAKCDFDQSYIINEVESLLDPEGCQLFCGETPNCEFFYHDSHYCTLYSKRNGHCNVISGPSYPKYDYCQDSSVTSTTESAPSGSDTIELTWELDSINLDLHLVLFSGYDIECEIYFNNPICSDAAQVSSSLSKALINLPKIMII